METSPTDSAPQPEDRPRRRRQLYAAPRRFDLATIFIVTTAYAILLGGLSSLGMHPAVLAVVAVAVTLVGIGQAVLFGGRKPRQASMLVGGVVCVLSSAAFMVAVGQPLLALLDPVAAGASFLQGAVLGYFAGIIVAGVFLVADILRGRF